MTHANILETLWDSSVGIRKIIWLAGTSEESLPRALEDFLSEDDQVVKDLFGIEPPNRRRNYEAFCLDLIDKKFTGYLVEAETPIQEESGLMSWSFTTTKWFYFPEWNEAQVVQAITEWADSKHPL